MDTVLTISDVFKSPQNLHCVQKIKEWIDGNTFYTKQHLIWNIGVTNAEDLLNIESTIRHDMTCKHWRYWENDSFKDAMETIRKLNKAPNVIKSPHNDYSSKGSYVFVYKTLIPRDSRLFHTLHA
ncbi:hypothetical protein [Roseivirga sp.]|uniref:hypothetical protein n=1 Tax=Roseivirga sp. TaxID=1964215 RepID=UPI002B26961C|nr:hypothetical protein [Roseivirga sp.]